MGFGEGYACVLTERVCENSDQCGIDSPWGIFRSADFENIRPSQWRPWWIGVEGEAPLCPRCDHTRQSTVESGKSRLGSCGGGYGKKRACRMSECRDFPRSQSRSLVYPGLREEHILSVRRFMSNPTFYSLLLQPSGPPKSHHGPRL